MAGIPDKELVAQLNAFMRCIPFLWTWDQLAALRERTHVEYRGNDENFITFAIYLLENTTGEARPYLHVAVHICDRREGIVLGSAYQPLCNSFLWYRDGEVDADELARFAYAWQSE
jgi:hypothetical protein